VSIQKSKGSETLTSHSIGPLRKISCIASNKLQDSALASSKSRVYSFTTSKKRLPIRCRALVVVSRRILGCRTLTTETAILAANLPTNQATHPTDTKLGWNKGRDRSHAQSGHTGWKLHDVCMYVCLFVVSTTTSIAIKQSMQASSNCNANKQKTLMADGSKQRHSRRALSSSSSSKKYVTVRHAGWRNTLNEEWCRKKILIISFTLLLHRFGVSLFRGTLKDRDREK